MNTFQFLSNEVRVFFLGEQYWFMAADVCRCLGLDNPTRALTALEADEKILYADYLTCTNPGTTLLEVRSSRTNPAPAAGTMKKMYRFHVINEAGLYRLVMGSRKEEARVFKRWVCHEVLPALRREGHYSMGGQGVTLHAVSERQLARIESLEASHNVLVEKLQRMEEWALGVPAYRPGHKKMKEVVQYQPGTLRKEKQPRGRPGDPNSAEAIRMRRRRERALQLTLAAPMSTPVKPVTTDLILEPQH